MTVGDPSSISAAKSVQIFVASGGMHHDAAPYGSAEILGTDGATTLYRTRLDDTDQAVDQNTGQAVGQDVGQQVLLKAVDSRRSGPADLARLRREFEIAASLDCTAIARPLRFETYEGSPAIVFEDSGGEPLDRVFAFPLPVGRFLDLSIRIVDAVADLHQAGVVHKDLKPPNILVHPVTLDVTLLGLGLATRLPRERHVARPPHLVEGSLPYMSPEQTGRTNSLLDSRSDLYSLGATFYQLLTGRLLSDSSDPLEWLYFHTAQLPVRPSQLNPQLPDPISQIVMRLLSKTAEDRYQTARGLARDLRRCRSAWLEEGRIASFVLRQHDVPDRLQFPHRLYGRDAETATLRGTLDRVVEAGVSELAVVSGYSGAGKSALAGQLESPTLNRGGHFVIGKADPYERDVPYSTLAQAFGDLILTLISEGEESSEAWAQKVQASLGTDGRLVTAVVPQVELLTGTQPSLSGLTGPEAQSRFRTVFRRFVAALCDEAHPLTVVLDDLQWADSDSLPLLQDLMTDPQVRHLLVVAAFRDNEVPPAHPLAQTLDATRAAGGHITRIALRPLSDEALTTFVSDTLNSPLTESGALAKIIRRRTGGNPLFSIQFLTEMYNDRILYFAEDTGTWHWDVGQLAHRDLADDVAELMVTRLKRLPSRTQEALTFLAFLGSATDLATLSWASEATEDQVREELWPALAEGFVVVQDGIYRFAHDSFREAAYSLIPPEAQPGRHLKLGRILLAHLPDAAAQQRAFEVAGHLDRGVALLRDDAERAVVRFWNVIAGHKARSAVAYGSAATYLRQAVELLPRQASLTWDDATFDLQVEWCECEYLSGDFAAGERICDQILQHARSDADRARAHRLRIRMYELAGLNNEAMPVARDALRLFGLALPMAPEAIESATRDEEHLVAEFVEGRHVADLAKAAPVSDPGIRAALGVVADSLSPAYMARQAHFPLLAAMGVNLCLRHGHTAESSSIYNSYALGRAGVGDFCSAFDFSDLALRLLPLVESPAARGIVLFRHGFFIHPWREHLATSLPYLHDSETACRAGGNLLYAGYARFAAIETALELGGSLDELHDATHEATDLARQAGSDAVRDTLLVQRQFVACLKGLTREPGSLEDDSFRDTDALAGFATWRHRVLKQVVSYLFGRYDDAIEASEAAAEALRGVVSLMLVATHHFYRALTLAALYPTCDDARRASVRSELDQELALHQRWAEHCPANFADRCALVAAEIARLDGRELDAERAYEQAIRSAREHGFVNNEALAYELAGRFYRERGFDQFADTYLRQARACYVRWGATGKVRQLEERHPLLAEVQTPVAHALGTTFAAGAEQLDLLSVVKASQTISGEMEVDKLVGTLLKIVVQHSGARRGCLLLSRDGTLTALAEAVLVETAVTTRVLPERSLDASFLPLSVVRRAQTTRQPVVLDDMTLREPGNGGDPYVVERAPRSVLALPVLRANDLLGVLYLENELVSGAFMAPGLLTTLSLLASQAAISMENALQLAQIRALNQGLEQRVASRTAELADANRELEAFAYSVSHDLRAPLRTIEGYRELLERALAEDVDDEARRYLANIALGVSRMGHLIDDLLSFARLARAEMSRRPVDLDVLTRAVIQDLMVGSAGRKVEWRVCDLPVVTGDLAMLRVVLTNLLSNALKFTGREPHPVIEVGAHRGDDGTTIVHVRDNGAGFDMAQEGRLFGVFQRLHSAKDFPGTGIGLANVRRVVNRLGGRTWAEGAPGAGATFYVALPAEAVHGSRPDDD